MNPQDPCARIKQLTLGIEGVCRRLAAKRCSVIEGVGIVEMMINNINICAEQADIKMKRLQMCLQKTTKLKTQLHEQVQELTRPNSLCMACSSSLEESFSDDNDSCASSPAIRSSPPPENSKTSTQIESQTTKSTP